MLAAHCRSVVLSLFAPLLLCAGGLSHPSLTVVMDFESPHSETSLHSLRTSLDQLLSPSGIVVDIQLRADLPDNPQFVQLVVFKMKGSCTMSAAYTAPIYDERGPLARAYTSDGVVLPFGEVECDRVRHSLQRILGSNSSLRSQQAYGSALAVVMAHELYHMLGNVKSHTHKGLTKAELSASELMDPKLALSSGALETIGLSLHSELPE